MEEDRRVCSLGCSEVEQAAAKFAGFLREFETIEAHLCAVREENGAIEEDVHEKTEESMQLRRLCVAALSRKHERLQTLRQISQVRKNREEMNETREMRSHATQQEILALQTEYNSLVGRRSTQQAMLRAERESLAEGPHKLREELNNLIRETEKMFACTTHVQEAVVAARQERDQVARELQSEVLLCKGEHEIGDLSLFRERQQAYNSLIESLRLEEQRKKNLLLAQRADTGRVIQFSSTKRTHAPPAPRGGQILSELIESAGKTKSPSRLHQHLDI